MDNSRLKGTHAASIIKVTVISRGLHISGANLLDLSNGRMTTSGKAYHYLGAQSMSTIEKHRAFSKVLRDFPYSVDQ